MHVEHNHQSQHQSPENTKLLRVSDTFSAPQRSIHQTHIFFAQLSYLDQLCTTPWKGGQDTCNIEVSTWLPRRITSVLIDCSGGRR